MIFVLLYQCFAGFLAWFNYWLIKNDYFKNWIHAVNGSVHLLVAFVIGYYTKWNFSLSTLLFTRVVFDTCLNIFRHKGVGYVSPAPKSKVDEAEKWIVLKLASIVYRNQRRISDEDIERVAIGVRIFILVLATGSLFV